MVQFQGIYMCFYLQLYKLHHKLRTQCICHMNTLDHIITTTKIPYTTHKDEDINFLIIIVKTITLIWANLKTDQTLEGNKILASLHQTFIRDDP